MQIILTKDVKGRGQKGDIIDVNPTFAQNVLFKQGGAIPANATNLNDNKGQKQAKDFHHGEEVKRCEKIRDEMKARSFEMTLKIGANGKAFGSISKQEVMTCLNKAGFDVAKTQIKDFEPIKAVGNYIISIQLMKEVKFDINLIVK